MMMNEKDFKKLLFEWNQNFVSEVASLIPHIRSLGNNQASKKIFIEECNNVSKDRL